VNLYGFVENDGVNKSDFLGLSGLHLSYKSEPIFLGECGSFEWAINWKVSPKSGAKGGAVLQEISNEAYSTPDPTILKESRVSEHYYEAWRVKPNSTKVSSTAIAIGNKESANGNSTDLWSYGSVDKTGGVNVNQPAFDNTMGFAIIQGWARYRDDISLDELWQQMPPKPASYAGELFSTASTKIGAPPRPEFKSNKKSNLVYRKLKITWNCLPCSAPSERKTKVEELIPEADKIYLPK
jgi:hypothetical protein